jgi:hypothetical protein
MIVARVLEEVELEVFYVEPNGGAASTPDKFIPRNQPSGNSIMVVE